MKPKFEDSLKMEFPKTFFDGLMIGNQNDKNKKFTILPKKHWLKYEMDFLERKARSFAEKVA